MALGSHRITKITIEPYLHFAATARRYATLCGSKEIAAEFVKVAEGWEQLAEDVRTRRGRSLDHGADK